MKAGISTILQTLTPEAATVLTHSIAEAGRRSHGQTTPLHVAATLLAPPNGLLRQACIRSNPNSSHPLQCRALELCFSVALERLPTAQAEAAGAEPPVSNALMAALKRAQAHQRRGCPEQQQQPLLAVKVELEQLVISILDDPSVSRVMREASFSSPAVKATIEKTLSSSSNTSNTGNAVTSIPATIGLGFRPKPPLAPLTGPLPGRNMYLNPKLQQGGASVPQPGNQKGDEVKRILEILIRTKKRNPILVGESEPESIVKELLRRIENKEMFEEAALKNLELVQLGKDLISDKDQIPSKINDLRISIENQMAKPGCGGVMLNLGDLKWLVEQPSSLVAGGLSASSQQVVCETGRVAVEEIGKLITKYDGAGGRMWLVGTATCDTYMRCQVYYSNMENDWDLQAVSIAAKAPQTGLFPRLGTIGIHSAAQSLSPLKNLMTIPNASFTRTTDNVNTTQSMKCCPPCTQKYEEELAGTFTKPSMNSSSERSEAALRSLPFWLQNTKAHEDSDAKATLTLQGKNEEQVQKQKTQELQNKWLDTCLRLHPTFHNGLSSGSFIAPTPLTVTGLYNSKLLGRQTNPPQLQGPKILEERSLIPRPILSMPSLLPEPVARESISKPASPVRTDLVLGHKETPETRAAILDEGIRDLISCISSEPQNTSIEMQANKLLSSLLDADSFKKLLRSLTEKVWWQKEAASAVATTVTQCKLGNGKQRGSSPKSDVWLLFTGPDRAAKKKIASVLSDVVCGLNPVVISLSAKRNEGVTNTTSRGKTVLDRITEAVRRNQFSVILLEDIDEADLLIRGSIKRAMERGRLADTHGREISLGSVIFILTTNSGPDNASFNQKLTARPAAQSCCQLRLVVNERRRKRRANWLIDDDRPWKLRKETNSALFLDLNEAADDEKANFSLNSSDLTVDHDNGRSHRGSDHLQTLHPAVKELINFIDNTVVFDPVNLRLIQQRVSSSIKTSFSSIIHSGLSIEVEEQALENICQGICEGPTGLEEWLENALVPSFQQLKTRMKSFIDAETDDCIVVQLKSDESPSNDLSLGDWLPDKIKVVVDGQCV
uniref:Clp R domain-containing protein n=1 Tax=Kalanchoe fedtschenkoi TaxID=63787 RepID=A0A7N0RG56_KALFE